MTRSELMRQISLRATALSEKGIELAVKQVFDHLIEAAGEGKRIEIRGFGSFSVRFRAERTTRNPKTGEYVRKKPKYSLHFKPGKEMRDRVNGSIEQSDQGRGAR